MKYIIEIEDEPFESPGSEHRLWKSTEFNSLVFDKTGLEKLTPYDESEVEQRGREEAWKLIKAIGKMTDQEMRECFGEEIIVNLSYTEAREKYEAWKKKKISMLNIRIGDEVERDDKTAVFVVTDITDTNMYAGFTATGTILGGYTVHKTGRHFPEIADLLEKMRKPE